MRHKKRSFTLIEVILSLGLLTFLLSALFFWIHYFGKSRAENLAIRQSVSEEKSTYIRLSRWLSHSKEDFFFTSSSLATQEESLVFSFDLGPNRDPELSHIVLGRLYLDRATQTLCLGIWPLPEKKHSPTPLSSNLASKTLPLLNNVQSLRFNFYLPPRSPYLKEKQQLVAGWQRGWLKEYGILPALVRIDIELMNPAQPSQPRLITIGCSFAERGEHPIIYSKGP